MYRVIYCKYGCLAQELLLPSIELKDLQKLVDGNIEVVPISFKDNVVVVCNEEALLKNLSLNRVLYSDIYETNQVIVGDFIILSEKETEDGIDFDSIDNDEVFNRYLERYKYPERIIKTNLNTIVGIPYDPSLKCDKNKQFDYEKDGIMFESIDVLDDD